MSWTGKSIAILTSLVFILSCNQKDAIQYPSEQNIDVVPKPHHLDQREGFFTIHPNVEFEVRRFSDQSINTLRDFIHSLNIEPHNNNGIIIVNQLPFEGNDEEYNLIVKQDSIFLSATNEVGILHGIASLKQLILLNQFNGNYFIPQIEINDQAQFQHRGLLLDCSRHFFEKDIVKKYIDLLALYKMNVLHWHLTEDQGWRIAIDQYPKLTSVASKRTELDGSEYGGIYSKADIREIVNYATDRGIEIIPEIELPGHSQAAVAAYPYLSCTGNQVEVANDWGVFKEIYCAGNDSVFTFLENVLSEVVELFPSPYIHIGGDEAPKIRWESCSKCQKRIADEHLEDEHELQAYFIKRIQTFLATKGKQIIGWDEILEGGLAEGAIVQSWRGFDGGIKAAKHGNQVIMSPTSHAYLDYDLKAIDLEKIYQFNPIPTELDSNYHSAVIGGECNMWTEHVPNSKVLDQKVFPRLLGMSEALWSESQKEYNNFKQRVQSQYTVLDHFEVNYGEETIPFTYTTEFDNKELQLVLSTSDTDLSLEYSSDPDTKTQQYTSPIPINQTVNYKVQAYKKGKKYGNLKHIPIAYHKALNTLLKYESPYNQWYTAGGNLGLVDGKLGSLDFRDGNWQGFWGKDANIQLDFDSLVLADEVQLNFYQYNNSWIFIPTEISIWYSKNGNDWIDFTTQSVKTNVDPKKRGKFIESISVSPSNTKQFKHLKIMVKNLGKVPDWHEAAGSDAWIFMDEIQVK